MRRPSIPLFAAIALLLLVAACANPRVTQPDVTAVTVTPAGPHELAPGDTLALDADVTAVGGADEAVTWSTSAAAVATVDANGLVTAVAPGDATITATSDFDDTVSGSVEVSVVAVLTEFDHCPAATGWYVSAASGAADAAGTTPDAPLSIIQAAVDAAEPGDTVCVAAGTYELDNSGEGDGGASLALVTITKPLTLVGPNVGTAGDAVRAPEATLVVSSSEADLIYAVAVNSGDVTVDGFAFSTTTPKLDPVPGDEGFYGVWVGADATDGVTVSNNHLVDLNFPIWFNRGTGAEPSSDHLVSANLVEGPEAKSDQAIYMQAAFGTVEGNVLRDTRVGIQVQPYEQAGTGVVSGNDIEAFQVGLWFNGQANADAAWTFTDNEVTGTASPWGWPLYASPDTNKWMGILVTGFAAGSVAFEGNTIAVGSADPPETAYVLRQRPVGGSTGTFEGIGTTTELGEFFTVNTFPDFEPEGVTLGDLDDELDAVQLPVPGPTPVE